jgi:hypothetical protein
MATAGYSGTPLAKKLGIAAGMRVATLGAPPEYPQWLAPLPPGVQLIPAARSGAGATLVHLFTTSAADLAARLPQLRKTLDDGVAVWVSWPKKAAKVPTDVTEDTIRALALPLGYVDVKVCAVSAVWSGLKLVVRKDLRR